MATHRPLSPWVARVLSDQGDLGAVNDGDARADARYLELFVEGWHREVVVWEGRSVLALRRQGDGLTSVELDDYGTPITAGIAAVAIIARAEETWPHVSNDVLALADEQLSLRYWLVERLDAEGDPPDNVFGLLPWELLDRAAESVSAALTPGGTLGNLVEMRHWLTPAVRGVTGPLEQLDHGLRSGAEDVAHQGAITLLTNLRDLPLSRMPQTSQRRLATLAARLGQTGKQYRELAEVVVRRLADGTSAVPDDISEWSAVLVPLSYLNGGSEDQPNFEILYLQFGGRVARLVGPRARGQVWRSGDELVVSLTRLDANVPQLTVDIGEPDSVRAVLKPAGTGLRARLAWPRPNLPQRLVFRLVAE